MTIDWGVGRYERTAAQLEPVAAIAVERAGVRPGERALDLGCGTGNAALLLAQRGADVVGVDPAARLLEVARGRAADAGLTIEFAPGEAAAIPLPDGSVDLVVSVFAIIFAPDAAAAMAEVARVVRPHGRVVLTAWLPDTAIGHMGRLSFEAIQAATGAPPAPPRFAWHDPAAVEQLVAAYGFEVDVVEQPLVFTAESAAAFVDADSLDHPVAVSTRQRAGDAVDWTRCASA